MNEPTTPADNQNSPMAVASGAVLCDNDELIAALNMAAAPWPLERKKWMEAAMQMSKYCLVHENCDQAAMRVLAAEVRRFLTETL